MKILSVNFSILNLEVVVSKLVKHFMSLILFIIICKFEIVSSVKKGRCDIFEVQVIYYHYQKYKLLCNLCYENA